MTTTKSDGPTTKARQVTVLGLGDMGSAIARTFVDRGYRTTVWNRTASKTEPLVAAGATAATTAVEAVAASPLIVVCLLDTAAVTEVLDSVDTAMAGKVLVNLTSGAPAQARATERWTHERDAQFIDGKILGDPPYVGTPQFNLLVSGASAPFERHESTLRELGNVTHYGEDAGLAAVEFMAQVAMGYELLMGFLHTLKLVQSEGVAATEFAQRFASVITAYPPLLTAIGDAVTNGTYPPDLGPLSVQAALMDDLIDHRESKGVETVRMREVKTRMDRQIAEGNGAQGFSSLFESLTKE